MKHDRPRRCDLSSVSPFAQSTLNYGKAPALSEGLFALSPVPLTQAVTSGDAGAVNALLATGANVNERTSGGQTPLILATIFGHTHLIPLLLNAGADPDLRDNLGLNAVDWAQRRGANEALELFRGKKPLAPITTQTEVKREPRLAVHSHAENPQSHAETETAKALSKEERSRRWLEGLKQRIAEQSQREAPDGSNIFRARPESEPAMPPAQEPPTPAEQPPPPTQEPPQQPKPAPISEPPPVSEPRPIEEPPRREPEPQITQIEQTQPQTAATARETPRPKSVRKRCPKCGAIYNSDLVAYCAHHFVALVDADDSPIISEPPRQSPALFWMIIVITLTGSLVVGSLITMFFFGSNKAAQQAATSPPTPVSVQKGTPSVGRELEGKVVSLPTAQCPLNGQEAIPGTVVVHVVINKDGQVTSARASGGDWLLRGAASEAAMRSTFAPERLRGRETEGTITYTFEP